MSAPKIMNDFCRIIYLTEGQVLLMMSYDDDINEEEGQLRVEQITEYNGARMSAIAGYKTEEMQLKHFRSFTDEDAQKFFNTAKEMLS